MAFFTALATVTKGKPAGSGKYTPLKCDSLSPGVLFVMSRKPAGSGTYTPLKKSDALEPEDAWTVGLLHGLPDGGLAALLEELQYSRREVQGRPAEALQYKQLQDAYHSKCAYHFQADVLPYFCMYPTLWWCGEYNDHELAACLCHSQPLTTHRSPLVTSRRGHVHPHGEA